MYFLMRKSVPISSSLGASLIRKNLLGEQILSFKSSLQIRSDIVSTIKVKNKNIFLYFRGYGKL